MNQSEKMAINTIYLATEGEGRFIGSPQIFVRFQGCAIGCVNCDSRETWDFVSGQWSLTDVMVKIQSLHPQAYRPRVSITGGDPLHPKHESAVLSLVKALKLQNYFVNLEASGSRIVDSIFDLVDFISFDFKTPSTMVTTRLELVDRLIGQYDGKFQIKSVISDERDFDYVYRAWSRLAGSGDRMIEWYLTPCYEPSEPFPAERFEMILKKNQDSAGPFRVVGQQHKWVFGPERKEV